MHAAAQVLKGIELLACLFGVDILIHKYFL